MLVAAAEVAASLIACFAIGVVVASHVFEKVTQR